MLNTDANLFVLILGLFKTTYIEGNKTTALKQIPQKYNMNDLATVFKKYLTLNLFNSIYRKIA
ncbi:hypothetical protein J15TS10_40840 [Paenibacillus woosongensis]|uniref:Uncharacterized protein n=1 Tax=Paenibacillus woosongensis TaxID=307580 RepID=A0ABQ4MWG7_9BACL|nr:hypothetical protein J15TS10_40840 [Paenibacillus woosongensis]